MRKRVTPIRILLRLVAILTAGVAVTGCGGGSGGSSPAPVNSPPTANAGADRTVDELTQVVLSGSAEDGDGTIRTYRWMQVSGTGVELADADTAQARFTAPDGTSGTVELVFRLTVTDDDGATANDEVIVTVIFISSPPTVDAGADRTIDELTEVLLSGSAEDDDGTIQSYRWTQVFGPDVNLADADTTEARFTAPDASSGSAELVFRLTVTDDSGATASDEVTVTVTFYNSPPTVDAGADRTVDELSLVALSGSARDADGAIRSYRWAQASGPAVGLVDPDTAQARFTAPDGPGGSATLIFRLTVTDDLGATAYDEVNVTVTFYNSPPTVDAGADQKVDELTEVVLSGRAQDDDGSIQTYQWTLVSGSRVDLVGADTAQARFTAPDGPGGSDELVFRLVVTDDAGATANDLVTVTVIFISSPPTVDAGADRTVDERTQVALSGSAQDGDGTIRSYRWTQVSGPAVDLVRADTAEARFTAPDGSSGSAELVFRLTVTDDLDATASDEVVITVTFANNPPTVRAGGHFTLLPARGFSYGIIAEDTDGTIVSYEWVQVSGPAVQFRSDANGSLHLSTPAGIPDGAGNTIELVFRLTVTDDQGGTATDEVSITVVFYNSLPTADAGADRSVNVGVWVTLSGRAEDPDGDIESSQWKQVSGPPVELVDSHRLVAGFNAPDAPGGAADLVFRLTVMDNDGATAIDEVIVRVVSNSPPSADAGPDRTVEENARVTLSGRAEDSDGTIQSNRWTRVSGPPVELIDPDALVASFTAPDIASGSDNLVFRLTVTDDRGAVANDEVSIAVADAGAVRVSGTITFDYVPAVKSQGLQYLATEARPVRGVTVELRDNVDDRFVDAAVTDENGDYAAYAPPDTTVFVRARAEILDDSGSWDVRVATNSGGSSSCGSDSEYPLYAMDSDPFNIPDSAVTRDLHAASGWTGDGYGEARVAAPFAILDVILDAMQFVRSSVGNVDFRPLHVFWGSENVGASHSSCQDKSILRLSGAENENTDEYDRSVIAHEWGHYVQASFSRNDSLGGPHNPLFDHMEMATAFSEGFASALGAVVASDPTYTSTFGPQQGNTAGFSVESVTHVARGWFIEASIAQIIYDLIDPVDDDTVELGFRPIFDVLVNEFRQSRSLTSIFSFVHALKERVPEICGRHRFRCGLSSNTANR